jgi:hypothetical protein
LLRSWYGPANARRRSTLYKGLIHGPSPRRRDPDALQETWIVNFRDVRVGTIAIRSGIPHDEDRWGWNCGFYPGSEPSEHFSGTATTFKKACADFKAAWRVFSAKRTEADYEAWRNQRDQTAWKYAMWDAGMKMPAQMSDGVARCFCGATITIRSMWSHARTHHRQTA